MASISGLLQPDILGAVNSGFDRGQDQRKNSILAQYAQSAVGGDQDALQKIYQSDPTAGLKLQQQSIAMGEQQKSIGDKDLARLGQHARLVTALADAGDTEGAANLYKTIYPEASKILGPNLPSTFDPSMVEHMRQIANSVDPQTKKDLINLTPGSTLIDPATGKPVYSQPAAAPNLVPLQTDQGFAAFNPKTGAAAPMTYAGGGQTAPTQDPMTALIASANARVKAGEDPNVVEADITRQAQGIPGADVQPAQGSGAPSGQRVMPKAAQGRTGGAPSGYRYQADGQTLEAIPGGPADKSSGVNQGLTEDAIENAAWQKVLTGDSGVKGYGKEATGQRAQIQNRVAEIAKQAGVSSQELATRAGQTKALQASFGALQKRADAMQTAERGFQNNIDLALQLSEKVDRSGSPIINKWLLGGQAALGDPDIAALDAAITTASTDYARIMSGQTGSAGTPISTAEEAKKLLRKELGKSSLSAVAEVLHKDIAGQQAAVDAQRDVIKQQQTQFGSSGSSKPNSSATPDNDPFGFRK